MVLATVAAAEPEGYVDDYTRAFADLGLGELTVFHALDKAQASDPPGSRCSTTLRESSSPAATRNA